MGCDEISLAGSPHASPYAQGHGPCIFFVSNQSSHSSPVCDIVGGRPERRPATAVRFGNRPAPSVGRHLTGQKGLGRPLRNPDWGYFYELRASRSDIVNLSLSRRNAASDSEANCRLRTAACESQLLSHVDTGGCSSDGDALHGPVFYGRTGAVPASAVWIGPNRQQYGTGSLQDENELPFIEVPQKS